MEMELLLKRQEEYKHHAREVASERAEKQKASRMPYLDKIRGGLVGGAIGDALGHPVEFMSWEEIQKWYGADGIQKYELDLEAGAAVVSDDTQMGLFTANGILLGETHGHLKGIQSSISSYVHIAYKEWLRTQAWRTDPEQEHHC